MVKWISRNLKTLSKLFSFGVLGFACWSLSPQLVSAAGNQIHEQSAALTGMGSSGQATWTSDASSAYYNPAALSWLEGDLLSLTLGYFDIGIRSNLYSQAFPGGDGGGKPGVDSPYGSVSAKFSGPGKWDYGLSLVSPYGLSIDYGSSYGGRFLLERVDFSTIQVNPVVSYKFTDKQSFAIGIGYQYSKLKMRSSGAGGPSTVQRRYTDDELGFNLAYLLVLKKDWTFGATYRSSYQHDYTGGVRANGTALPSSIGIKTPASWNVSLKKKIAKLEVITEIGQVLWSANQSTTITDNGFAQVIPRHFRDAWRYGLAFQYFHNSNWVYRAGISTDEAAAEDRYRAPDVIFDKQWRYGLGATWKLCPQHEITLGYEYADLGKNRMDLKASDFGFDLSGTVDAHWQILALQWNYRFD